MNLVSLGILHGIKDGNLNTRGAYLHVLGDALGSVGALAAAAIIATTGWTLADPIVSIALALLILVGAWRLMRESTDILLESVPGHVSMAEVQRRILGVTGVTAVHDLHVWGVTSELVAMSGHAIVPDLAHHPEVLERIRAEMCQLGIGHVTIQLEVQHECEEPRPQYAGASGPPRMPRHRADEGRQGTRATIDPCTIRARRSGSVLRSSFRPSRPSSSVLSVPPFPSLLRHLTA